MNPAEHISTTTMFSPEHNIESTIFVCPAHKNNLSKKVQTFYENADIFDIVLVADSDKTSLSAHRFVLSASSDYFLAMFRSSLKEATAAEVTIKDIDGATLRTLLNFMYTGSIELSCESIQTILKAAGFFQMITLVEACSAFIKKRLDVRNCLGIAYFAEQHGFTELYKSANSFTLRNFEKVAKQIDFFKLSEEQICNLISSDDLSVRSEETVFLSVVAWVEFDKTIREKSILELLSLVRFTLLKPKFIVDNMNLVCKTIEAYEFIRLWLQWHLSPEKRQELALTNTQPRNNKILAFISVELCDYFKLQTFDPVANTWSDKLLPQMPVSKENYRITVINQKLIITGGFEYLNNEGRQNSVECLDLLTNEWTNLSAMGTERASHATTTIDGNLYVVGGCHTGITVEKYDFSINRWQYLESLPFVLEEPYAIASHGNIYVISRRTGDMVCYDSIYNKWIPKRCKTIDVNGFGCAEVCEKLFAVGGSFRSDLYSRFVECYNIDSDYWQKKKSLKSDRSYVYCTTFHDRLIVAGGHDAAKDEFINLVAEYDPEKDEWTELAPLLNHSSSFNCGNLLFTM